MVRRPIESFFVLAFALSWVAVLPIVLNPSLPPEPFQIIGGVLGPTLAAVILLSATEGRSALGRFFRR